ncbi:IS110 family transposase [Xylanimonas allomyrinae]|uniref:IS110 family transposase n=1 Tax=Xylanimonas allomyrinae TaxID=2509459 RepID=A0A4P6EJM6_9MICO|nr:IS110 family transposase [Xylanimonas allomyrinae]QAY62555.1 IS110 family transposase [Xylanimonas allomyrinae]
MTIVAHDHPFVIGVDTHAKSHALSILAAPTGEIVDDGQFPTTPAGLARAIAWVARRTGGDLAALWVIECAATFGAQLAKAVTAAGYQVVEAARMSAKANRGLGKSDPLDARRIAAAVLPLNVLNLRHLRKDDGTRAALRVVVAARDHMTSERTGTINTLIALLRAVDLGIDARKPLSSAQILEVSRWRTRTEEIGAATARAEALRLARRVIALDEEIAANTKTMTELLHQSPARALLEMPGIGPVTAAVAMAAWSHDGRLRDEAAFAALAGVNPIPASSGNTVRHRLNRGGDRRLNQALHMAVVVRMRWDPETKAYVERRSADGRTKKEIRRCLKRYLARQIYRTLTATTRTAEPIIA